MDQTRGWFYSLHAISTLLFDQPCYRNCVCLGLILDADGFKMSKSRGNVVKPWDVLDVHGADALRWYLYAASPPGNERRFSVELVGDVVRKFLLTLWNTYSFFVTYANIDGFNPVRALAARERADRFWIGGFGRIAPIGGEGGQGPGELRCHRSSPPDRTLSWTI